MQATQKVTSVAATSLTTGMMKSLNPEAQTTSVKEVQVAALSGHLTHSVASVFLKYPSLQVSHVVSAVQAEQLAIQALQTFGVALVSTYPGKQPVHFSASVLQLHPGLQGEQVFLELDPVTG